MYHRERSDIATQQRSSWGPLAAPAGHSPAINLAPAKWVWFPSGRCLPNTFILFRRLVELEADPVWIRGWITADSRYCLTVDGVRIQWGPSPCDPRWLEADPVDLSGRLTKGRHVLAVQVLYYGTGDGTYPMGAPGFLAKFDVKMPDGSRRQIVTDRSWHAFLDRAHRPGMYKRWFLRALQEEFDARRHPLGWDQADFREDSAWLPAMELPGKPDQPAIFAGGPEHMLNTSSTPFSAAAKGQELLWPVPRLLARALPLPREELVPVSRMAEAGRVRWLRDPADWFESRVPAAMKIVRQGNLVAEQPSSGDAEFRPSGGRCTVAPTGRQWVLPPTPHGEGIFATFEFHEQMAGFPRVVVDAPADTIVELLFQESHDPHRGPAWLDTHFFQWARLICHAGINTFEAFDYESLRWIQVHVRNASHPVRLLWVGMRRRVYPWPHAAQVDCREPPLKKLFEASLNTLANSCLDTLMDGAGRERQQYSGDGGHQAQTIRYAYGDSRPAVRFLTTFSQGLTVDGYFLDCWPAYDRLVRLAQRQVGATAWGPLLDHGIGFNFDCWNYYWETGDLETLRPIYPRLIAFSEYLQRTVQSDGLLPVEHIGVPSVWMDHDAYRQQRHKQCAFNLYAAAALREALARLAGLFADRLQAQRLRAFSERLLTATVARFWCARRKVFVCNLPWERRERTTRYDDRSLAEAILFDFCPGGLTESATRLLADCPPQLGLSYPANAIWRLRALARVGRQDCVLKDLRTRWAAMESVACNNTLQETWTAVADGTYQYSHCAIAPLQILFSELLGISATAAGFTKYRVAPRLGDLMGLDVTAWTAVGPIKVAADFTGRGHRIAITAPPAGQGVLIVGGNRRRLKPAERIEVTL